MYCKHCGEKVYGDTHNCRKKGLLKVDSDDSFLVSAAIGLATGSTIVGGLLGGDFLGAALGDAFEGDGIIDDDDW